MNKFLSGLKGAAPFVLAAAVLALAFVPIPLWGIAILTAARFWLAVCI